MPEHKMSEATPDETPQQTPAEKEIRTREEFFAQFLERLQVPLVKSVAVGFFENIRQVESLVNMPFVMFSFLEVDAHILKAFTASVGEYWSRGVNYSTFLTEYNKQPPFNVAEVPDFMDRIQKRTETILSHPTYGRFLTSSMQVLYSAAISASWTAFECLATDLWVASLNERPQPLAQSALSSLDVHEPGELSGKQISVGLAAKYGFDLRHCLGTLLKPKFDFTSVSGIQKAYRVFTMDEFVRKIFAEPLLSELEATRHLIVHRASRVDEEYRKRTSSSRELGSALTFSAENASVFARTSEKAGFGLLAFVNDWFVRKGKTKSGTS